MVQNVLCKTLCALLFLPLIMTSSLTAQSSSMSSPLDKVYSVVLNTIDLMKSQGINAENARSMIASKHFNSLMSQFDDLGRIGLIIETESVSNDVISQLTKLGGNVTMIEDEAKLITVFLPIDKLEGAAQIGPIKIIRPLMRGISNTGTVTTEGDSIHHARDVRNDLNVKGDSVKVGVISDGCTNWVLSQILGDLPLTFGPPNYTFAPPANVCIGSGDEGTAMLEIVNDLAPQSDLYFYGALGGGSGTMIDAIKRLVREKHCDIIVDDLTFFDQPMFEDATVATSNSIAAWAKWANDTGVVYVSSAGNWAQGGSTDRSHYQATYNDIKPLNSTPRARPLPNGPIPIPPPIEPPPNVFDDIHDFDPGPGFDPGLKVAIPRYSGTGEPPRMYVILEWTDPTGVMPDAWGACMDDYDLYLYDKNFVTRKASSIGAQVGAQNPYEALWYYNVADTAETLNVVIDHFAPMGAPAKLLGLYIYGCSYVEYNTPQNSIWGQPGVPAVLAVGAVPANNINLIEPYSSRGNYDVYVPAFQSRQKPDIVAVDKVAITGVGGFPPWGGPFGGTSAAAPHVAGIAALILSKYPALTPAQVHSKLERTAVDLGAVGFDPVYGNGRVDAERAMLEVNTVTGSSGPYKMNSTTTVPMFFGTANGYASNTITITGGISPPATVSSTVNVTSGNPFTDAGIINLGCPTVNRWYQFDQTAGISKMYDADITAYVDESERLSSGIAAADMRLIHWNGNYFDILPQLDAATKIGNTWKVKGQYTNAAFSPFFVGNLTRGVDVSTIANSSGKHDSTVTVKFSIRNNGNGWDTLSLHSYDKKGWTISPVDTALSLTAAQQIELDLSVKISSSEPAGAIDTIWVVAKSVSDPTYTDSSLATVNVITGVTTIACNIRYGWNMISLPLTVDDASRNTLYPTAVSNLFGYNGSYTILDTMENGSGYWIKINKDTTVDIKGYAYEKDTIDVIERWNMIGSISDPVAVDSITSIPGGIIATKFYWYDGIYHTVDTIFPGKGHWVKVNRSGKLILHSSASSIIPANRLRIIQDGELPPPPPDGEVRNLDESSHGPQSAIPKQFALEQNFPNPFNPLTIINYQLPIGKWVTIKVYNLLGEEVTTLVNEFQVAGFKSVQFDASASGVLPSGIYTYRLQTDSYFAVRKMIVLK